MDRARDGFRQLYEFISAAQTGVQPADRTFISIIRLLIRYPEILAWEQLWHESKESLKQEIYGEVKQIQTERISTMACIPLGHLGSDLSCYGRLLPDGDLLGLDKACCVS